MNSREPIQKWRDQSALTAASSKGWKVIFVADAQGKYPTLDYLDGNGPKAEADFPVTNQHLARLAGLLGVILSDGPAQLRGNSSFVEFVGEDAGMCELRIIPKQGHRFLCFQHGDREFLVTHAFRKPGQRETPKADKTAAIELLKLHKARLPTPPKIPETGTKRKD